MAVRNFEISWISDTEGYGLFATKPIPPGTKILEEKAVVLPKSEISELIRILYLLKTTPPDDIFLYEATKATLRAQQEPIALRMETFKTGIVKNTPSYTEVMQRHANRHHPAITEIPQMPSSLFYDIIGKELDPASADPEVVPWALRNINDYFLGALDIRDSQSTVWGPHTAFINHACRPNASVVCLSKSTEYEEVRHENIGLIAVHALTHIEEGEQITIEYWPTLGDLETRREELKRVGIGKCECNACASEEQLSLQAEDTEEYAMWQWLEELNRSARTSLDVAIPMGDDNRAVAPSIQSIWTCLDKLEQLNYHGIFVWFCMCRMMDIAKNLNDGVRVHWLAQWAQKYALKAYGQRSQQYLAMVEDQRFSAQESRWYDGKYIHSVCYGFDYVEDDAKKVFMVEHYPYDHYQFLQPSPDGSLMPVEMEANGLYTLQVLKDRMCKIREENDLMLQQLGVSTTTEQDRKAAELADHAALTILAEEAGRASKAEYQKQKEKDRKKEQRRRKKAEKKCPAEDAAAQELDKKLAPEAEDREREATAKHPADDATVATAYKLFDDEIAAEEKVAAETRLMQEMEDCEREARERPLADAATGQKTHVDEIPGEKKPVREIEDHGSDVGEKSLAEAAATQPKLLEEKLVAAKKPAQDTEQPAPQARENHLPGATKKELRKQKHNRRRENRAKRCVDTADAQKLHQETIAIEKLAAQKRRKEKIAAEKQLAKQIEDRERKEREELAAKTAVIQKRIDDRIAAVVSATVTPVIPPLHQPLPVEVPVAVALRTVDQEPITVPVAQTTPETIPESEEAVHPEVTPMKEELQLMDETSVIEQAPVVNEAPVTETQPTIRTVPVVEEPLIVPEAPLEEAGPATEEGGAVQEPSVADTAPTSPPPIWSSPIFSPRLSPASSPPWSISKTLSAGSLSPIRTTSPPPIFEAEQWPALPPPYLAAQTPPAAPEIRSASPIPLESPAKPRVRLPPLLVITPPRAPTPPPQHRRFRANSNPEAALLGRWMANEHLRVPDFNDDDDEIAVSESELNLRKWFHIRHDIDYKFVATDWVIRWLS